MKFAILSEYYLTTKLGNVGVRAEDIQMDMQEYWVSWGVSDLQGRLNTSDVWDGKSSFKTVWY